ncbi:MAG TPA: 3-hydroxyacyl-CoA dehydrogenase NAD-binding domain-containing protein [Terriglobia bacterium]|nr:3-hydroxyacyl-CoA dehydrogenase NAD-binding domain-containing protein [Terriglobia bacterium]
MTQSINESIHAVGVVGSGTMGRGIAHTLLRHGYSVLLSDASPNSLAAAAESISNALARDVEKSRLTEAGKRQALAKLKTSAELALMASANFVIEAVTEDFDVKAEVLRQLDTLCPPEAIFTSNTSSISITRLAAVTSRASQFCGLHFFNPVPVMKLVEVVAGIETLPETIEKASALAVSLDKTPIRVSDFPGFVSNRVLMPMINEAIYAVMEGVADPQAVDGVMKLGMNHPMGPLELADMIGLDVCLDIMKVLYESFRDSKYRPCPLLEKMVHARRLGRKTGQGFYDYRSKADTAH